MQFIVMGYDGTDGEALARRMAARDAHLARTQQSRVEGKCLYAAALLDDAEKMIGSMMILDVADRAELDAWLADEPYIHGNVWQRVETLPCRVPPSFR